jgi:hypothetical protein
MRTSERQEGETGVGNIRLIVSDLDGTLLSPDHRLTDTVREAVRRFVHSGGLFTIATGRFAPSVQPIVEALSIDIPYILCNGAVIADRRRIWAASSLPVEELAPFLAEADRQGVAVLLFQETGANAFRRTRDVELFEQKEGITCRLVNPAEEWRGGPVQKALLIGDMERIRTIWETYRPGFRRTYTTIQSEDDYFEIIPDNQSKGAALTTLMKLLRVEPQEVMALGNQLNDLDMLCRAGIGVAVANSHPELISRADFVCCRSYGDGVVEAMDIFCFGRR